MSEVFWAQVISGFFGLASMSLGIYLPYRLRRNDERAQRDDRSDESGPTAPPHTEATR